MYDAIVVGARCAGSPTAMLLARKGYRVLLVDRATFPSDTMSTHCVGKGLPRLRSWGLLEQVLGINCPWILRRTFTLGDFPLTFNDPPRDGIPAALCPRRITLDKILVDAAVNAGAELREGFSVNEILLEGHKVIGVLGRLKGGPIVTERGRIVIGADGRHSLVARSVRAPRYKEVPPLMCWYYTYWSNVPTKGFEKHILYDERIQALVLPTNDGLTAILIGWGQEQFHTVKADIEGHYMTAINCVPGLPERMQEAQREDRFLGGGDFDNFFCKPFGPGWALVGDAGYHKDPTNAIGISDAFRDADLLAGAIDAGFSGRIPLEEAFADYERQRNEDALPSYENNCDTASFKPPPPELLEIRAALKDGSQQDIDQMFAAHRGRIPREEFFSAENIQRIKAEAERRNYGG